MSETPNAETVETECEMCDATVEQGLDDLPPFKADGVRAGDVSLSDAVSGLSVVCDECGNSMGRGSGQDGSFTPSPDRQDV